LTLGAVEAREFKRAAARKRALPAVFAQAPEVPFGTQFLLEAFDELSTCRALGFGGAGPIPWTAVQQYAEAHGYDDETRDVLLEVVRALDLVYMNWMAERLKSDGDAGGVRRGMGQAGS